MSMAKCKNTILSRSLNDNNHQAKRSPPIDHHGHHHGHSHHTGGGGTTHHGHHSSTSSSHHGHHHGHLHGHHNNSSSSSSASGSTVAAVAHAHQHNHHNHTTHHQQPPQIAHHHSFHPTTSLHHHHPSSHGTFNPPTSDPLPTSLYAKHVMSSSTGSTINSNSNLVHANDHHSPHHHSSHHNSHHSSHHGTGGGSHHNSHHSPNHHSSPHHSHHNFHHLHNNYSIYGDSSTPERDMLSTSSSSGATGAHLSLSSRNLSHGNGGHESSLSPNLGSIPTAALELSTHNYHGEDHATASPPSLITRRSHWSEVGVNEAAGGKGLNMETSSGNGGEGGTDGDGDGSDSGSTNLNPSTPQSIYDSSLSAIDNSSSSLLTPSLKKAKRQPQPIPDNCKDDAYWERRRRNNESAKRSRESRRLKEHQTHLKVKMLEHDNMRLLAKVSILENEVEKLRKMVYDRREGTSGNGVIINSENDGRDSSDKTSSGDHKMLH